MLSHHQRLTPPSSWIGGFAIYHPHTDWMSKRRGRRRRTDHCGEGKVQDKDINTTNTKNNKRVLLLEAERDKGEDEEFVYHPPSVAVITGIQREAGTASIATISHPFLHDVRELVKQYRQQHGTLMCQTDAAEGMRGEEREDEDGDIEQGVRYFPLWLIKAEREKLQHHHTHHHPPHDDRVIHIPFTFFHQSQGTGEKKQQQQQCMYLPHFISTSVQCDVTVPIALIRFVLRFDPLPFFTLPSSPVRRRQHYALPIRICEMQQQTSDHEGCRKTSATIGIVGGSQCVNSNISTLLDHFISQFLGFRCSSLDEAAGSCNSLLPFSPSGKRLAIRVDASSSSSSSSSVSLSDGAASALRRDTLSVCLQVITRFYHSNDVGGDENDGMSARRRVVVCLGGDCFAITGGGGGGHGATHPRPVCDFIFSQNDVVLFDADDFRAKEKENLLNKKHPSFQNVAAIISFSNTKNDQGSTTLEKFVKKDASSKDKSLKKPPASPSKESSSPKSRNGQRVAGKKTAREESGNEEGKAKNQHPSENNEKSLGYPSVPLDFVLKYAREATLTIAVSNNNRRANDEDDDNEQGIQNRSTSTPQTEEGLHFACDADLFSFPSSRQLLSPSAACCYSPPLVLPVPMMPIGTTTKTDPNEGKASNHASDSSAPLTASKMELVESQDTLHPKEAADINADADASIFDAIDNLVALSKCTANPKTSSAAEQSRHASGSTNSSNREEDVPTQPIKSMNNTKTSKSSRIDTSYNLPRPQPPSTTAIPSFSLPAAVPDTGIPNRVPHPPTPAVNESKLWCAQQLLSAMVNEIATKRMVRASMVWHDASVDSSSASIQLIVTVPEGHSKAWEGALSKRCYEMAAIRINNSARVKATATIDPWEWVARSGCVKDEGSTIECNILVIPEETASLPLFFATLLLERAHGILCTSIVSIRHQPNHDGNNSDGRASLSFQLAQTYESVLQKMSVFNQTLFGSSADSCSDDITTGNDQRVNFRTAPPVTIFLVSEEEDAIRRQLSAAPHVFLSSSSFTFPHTATWRGTAMRALMALHHFKASESASLRHVNIGLAPPPFAPEVVEEETIANNTFLEGLMNGNEEGEEVKKEEAKNDGVEKKKPTSKAKGEGTGAKNALERKQTKREEKAAEQDPTGGTPPRPIGAPPSSSSFPNSNTKRVTARLSLWQQYAVMLHSAPNTFGNYSHAFCEAVRSLASQLLLCCHGVRKGENTTIVQNGGEREGQMVMSDVGSGVTGNDALGLSLSRRATTQPLLTTTNSAHAMANTCSTVDAVATMKRERNDQVIQNGPNASELFSAVETHASPSLFFSHQQLDSETSFPVPSTSSSVATMPPAMGGSGDNIDTLLSTSLLLQQRHNYANNTSTTPHNASSSFNHSRSNNHRNNHITTMAFNPPPPLPPAATPATHHHHQRGGNVFSQGFQEWD